MLYLSVGFHNFIAINLDLIMKIINFIIGLCVLVGCAPSPQECGQLTIMNCTGTTLSVQLNLVCPTNWYCASSFSMAPDEFSKVAETENFPAESGSIAIDKFFTNYNDAAITVCATIEGIEITRTWRYADRNNDQRTPFDLSDCHLESGEDSRKNYTTMNYCFMIREEDLRQE